MGGHHPAKLKYLPFKFEINRCSWEEYLGSYYYLSAVEAQADEMKKRYCEASKKLAFEMGQREDE